MYKVNLLLIGPIPPPTTGVAISNQIILENLPLYSQDIVIDFIDTNALSLSGDVGKFSWKKIFYYATKYRDTIKIFWHGKSYMTIGLTFWGVLKYAPYICLSKILRKEVIVHIHSDYLWQEYDRLNGWFRWVFKVILSMTDKGIVLSPLLKRNLQPFLNEKDIYVVPNCVDNYLFQFDLFQKLDSKFDKLRILYFGNLMREKGIFDLLEALMILKVRKVPFKAALAGYIEKGIESKIEEILEKLTPEVRYFGVIHGEAKKELMVDSNVFVLPTYYSMEGQPISMIEAMATGNVILTTEHAGIPDIFEDGINGYYVKWKNPISIANKLLFIHDNLEKQKDIALNNFLDAEKKYKLEDFVLGIKHVLEK